ncbi:unnamed protein product, partial [Prorocentrum cordatum]
ALTEPPTIMITGYMGNGRGNSILVAATEGEMTPTQEQRDVEMEVNGASFTLPIEDTTREHDTTQAPTASPTGSLRMALMTDAIVDHVGGCDSVYYDTCGGNE